VKVGESWTCAESGREFLPRASQHNNWSLAWTNTPNLM
jgi:hypothetical protein